MSQTKAFFSTPLKELNEEQVSEKYKDIPPHSITRTQIDEDSELISLLVSMGAHKSRGESRKMITGGGIYLNEERVSEPTYKLSASDFIGGKIMIVRVGKKRHYLVNLVD